MSSSTAGKHISVEDASLSTATVEIQTITVRGRKVTQALFRQIQDEQIINDDFSLKGIPWGWVNYFWGNDKDETGINVVWQLGSELRRCVVSPRHVPEILDSERPVEEKYCVARAKDFLSGKQVKIVSYMNPSAGFIGLKDQSYPYAKCKAFISNVLNMKVDRYTALAESLDFDSTTNHFRRIEVSDSIRDHLQETAEECINAWSSIALEERQEETVKNKQLVDDANRHNIIYETLREKPQLFIAM